MTKPNRINKESIDTRQTVSQSNLPSFLQSLVKQSKLPGYNSKNLTVKNISTGVYSVELTVTQPVKQISFSKLYETFKKNDIRILDGSMYIGFNSGKLDTKTTIKFKVRMLKRAKRSKGFRLKLNKTHEKIRAFVEDTAG
jgi:hypothetical protein